MSHNDFPELTLPSNFRGVGNIHDPVTGIQASLDNINNSLIAIQNWAQSIADHNNRTQDHVEAGPKFLSNTTTSFDMSSGHGTADSPVTLYTVTGDVMISLVGIVQDVAVTSTGSTGTLEVGTAGTTTNIMPLAAVNGTNFAAKDVWSWNTAGTSVQPQVNNANWHSFRTFIGGGDDIILTIRTANMTAGKLYYYCWWNPLSPGANVQLPQ